MSRVPAPGTLILMTFEDRRDAGRRLGEQLGSLAAAGERPVVVGLPRGGVPVAAEVAMALGAPLEVLGVRKLGAPGNPELAVGAVAEDGSGVLDGEMTRRFGMSPSAIRDAMHHAGHELLLQTMRLRRGRTAVELRGRTVVLVDDGLATGLTALAAVRAARARGAARVIVAAPVGSPDAIATLGGEADDVICHTVPERLGSVGAWYDDFAQVPEDEIVALLRTAAARPPARGGPRELLIDADGVQLPADLAMVRGARGLVIFSHGSGSNRHSPRNVHVARALREAGFATLLADLVPDAEHDSEELVFDVPLRAARVAALVRWAQGDPATRGLPIGLFGASTGAAAALIAAARLGDAVAAVVSRGGRPDLAGEPLAAVDTPTLLVVGDADQGVLQCNRRAASVLHCPMRLATVPGAGHLFAEPGALDAVAALAIEWFTTFLTAPAPAPAPLGGASPLIHG